uniref:Uncharacterized protein n=1 Tax=Erpetoichthys calabaricus TaxID=27687 RepID=A0A8C4RF88_ERPCA
MEFERVTFHYRREERPTLFQLLSNITELDLNVDAHPGELILKSDKAIPVLKDNDGAVLIAATEFGKGRMVAFGHESYLKEPKIKMFICQCVKWLKSNSDAVVGIPQFYESFQSILTAAGHKVKVSDKFDRSMGVFFINAQEQISQLSEITEFIKGGGGVMIGAQAWHWCICNPGKDPLAHFPANKFTGLADIYFGPNNRPPGCFKIHTTTCPEKSKPFIKPSDKSHAIFQLLENITELDLIIEADPGELIVKSAKAIPILKDEDGTILMAATEYGKGRMVVFGHEAYLKEPNIKKLICNCVKWLKSNPDAVVGIPKYYESVASILTAAGHKVKVSDKFDRSMGVFFINGQEQISQLSEINEFIKGGGGVLIGTQAWSWCYSNPGKDPLTHYPANKLTGLADIYFGPDSRARGFFTIHMKTCPEKPDTFIRPSEQVPAIFQLLQNITVLDLNIDSDPGELVLKSTKAIPILKDQAGAVLMAAAEYGKGRMVVFGHEAYLKEPNIQMLICNCVKWLKLNPNAVVGIPKYYESVASILTAAGHKVKVSDKFDSSMGVFFINGQEQISQLPEITEFIKGGGGVMIGAQAWCWCIQNPGKDPLAHFPANKLTGLADIYFGANKRPRGYFTIHLTTSEESQTFIKPSAQVPVIFQLLENITELDLNIDADPGELVVKSTKAIPILKDQAGAVLMAATEYGKGRMVVFGHEAYLKEPNIKMLICNCVKWLKSNPNAVVGIPKFYESVASILTAAGHKVKVSDKFDRSMGVFFINGQEQISQLPEITEFIKGGGGVMIGAQAWCWCIQNPGTDPLAHFPANKLTGLADIYFGPNKRPRGHFRIHKKSSLEKLPQGAPEAFGTSGIHIVHGEHGGHGGHGMCGGLGGNEFHVHSFVKEQETGLHGEVQNVPGFFYTEHKTVSYWK